MEEKKMQPEVQPQGGEQMQQEWTAEMERRVAEAVQRARAQWDADREKADAERRKVAGMTQEERAGYEMSRREADLEQRERRLMERELRAMALEKLAERGLPRELADALPYTGEAECLKGLDHLEKVFRAAVQTAVDLRLRGEAPKGAAARPVDGDALTDEEYYRLNAKM